MNAVNVMSNKGERGRQVLDLDLDLDPSLVTSKMYQQMFDGVT